MDEQTYAIDPEDPAEMARLTTQDSLVTQGMGGLLPEWRDHNGDERLPPCPRTPRTPYHVLDVGCGPGSWVLDMAFAFPSIDVAGIDISKIMINYANARAQTQNLTNASFGIMNVLNPLDFSENTFDLVNMRFATGFLRREAWPKVLDELFRVTTQGGYVRVTELDTYGVTTSPALEKLLHAMYLALHKAGYGFSPDGSTLGLTPVLPRLLSELGCCEIQSMSHALDFSVGTALHASQIENYAVFFLMIKPMLLKQQQVTLEEFENLYGQMLLETKQDDFCGVWYLRTVWGKKPLSYSR